MFANQIFQDSKENIKSSMPTKTNIYNSRKGLKPCSLNSFTDSTNVLKTKKAVSENNFSCSKFRLEEKENSKQEVNIQETKVSHQAEEDSWSDIEEMHICIEPDDDYEDILPRCERIQKEHIDSLFFTYPFTNYRELTVDELPSPLKDFQVLDIPDFSPTLPEMKASLFDDSELGFIPLPNDLFEG